MAKAFYLDTTTQIIIALLVGAFLVWAYTAYFKTPTYFNSGPLAVPGIGMRDSALSSLPATFGAGAAAQSIESAAGTAAYKAGAALDVAAGYAKQLPEQLDADGGSSQYNVGAPVAQAPDNAAPTSGALASDLSSQSLRGVSCYPKQQLTAQDLLPNDNDTLWAQVNPSVPGAGEVPPGPGYSFGIDSVGQVLRNANLQLRSEPPNPQLGPSLTPWNLSTISPDTQRRQFDLGDC